MIKGLFFDLDGTLVNTYEADFCAYKDAIYEIAGTEIDQKAFYATNGMEMRQKLAILIPGLKEEQIAMMRNAKKRYYNQYLHLTQANNELIGFLKSVKSSHKVVLVTTAKKDNAMAVLNEHNLTQYFSEMVFGDEVTKSKPDPQPYLIALERSRLLPHEVVAFEDSDTGVMSAEAANIAVIRVNEFML